jgi:hypothetical protein
MGRPRTRDRDASGQRPIVVTVTQLTYDRVQLLAASRPTSISQYLRDLIDLHLEKIDRDVAATRNPDIARVLGRGI